MQMCPHVQLNYKMMMLLLRGPPGHYGCMSWLVIYGQTITRAIWTVYRSITVKGVSGTKTQSSHTEPVVSIVC